MAEPGAVRAELAGAPLFAGLPRALTVLGLYMPAVALVFRGKAALIRDWVILSSGLGYKWF